ncbi:hypothetical protein D9613_003841 [Agrocybe pediades]|uniref:Uncharacterized protein n=1 Tax=Agrocybe pediades TaxID=84607 RepID=A0A8H4QJK3_9AGAR|nr:hypothetical protein D9613_003841 [Agrocybe pediades]
MWSKLTNALKPHSSKDVKEESTSGEVLSKVIEQHPNMSMFHTNESGVVESPTVEPNSPSVHGKRNMFKRLSRAALKDEELQRPSLDVPNGGSNKVRGQNEANGSQLSLNIKSTGQPSTASQTMPRRSSVDMLRTSPRATPDTTRSVKDSPRRPSLDFLRQAGGRTSHESINLADDGGEGDFMSPAFDKFSSKRSILRGPNTPGTGQNVRFFPKDAFKVITPDQSLSTEFQEKPQQPSAASGSNGASVTRSSSASKSRPSVAEIFSPLTAQENPAPKTESSDMSLSFTNHSAVTNENSNLFDVSQQLDMPNFPPPGLGFDENAPMFESDSMEIFGTENSGIIDGLAGSYPNQMTSTPHKPVDLKGKGKESNATPDQSLELPSPTPQVIDEAVFHQREKSPQFAAPLHERSQSFSFGQTQYFSLGNTGSEAKSPESEAAYPSSDLRPDSIRSSPSASSPLQSKNRSRAMSDTVFQSMLRSTNGKPPSGPEADINDHLKPVVYSAASPEPDPFSANANTYYTAQTMIPTTPPRGTAKHNRKTSKEESLIISLQTQLALRTELCAQYETDLKARDELVEILEKKVTDFEKDEARKKNSLRSWKKKVQELEKACRQLQEEVQDSRQESLERSVMDEASGEALRMLHRQIASLEREKEAWVKREHLLKEEVETLEALVRERSEDIMHLKESLWSRDETDRALNEGIRDAKEQIEMMGNVSVGMFDEEELKKLLAERDQKNSEETQRFHLAEIALKQELEELKLKSEGLEVQKTSLEEALEEVRQQLRTRDEEYETLKAELEAQWEHTEKATDKIILLEREKTEALAERDALKADLQELEARTSAMEAEWNESENKKNEVEAELQEVWDLKDNLEKDREELENALQHEREHADQLTQELQQRDTRISELEAEQQFVQDNVTRLEENVHRRDEELTHYSQRLVDRESELETLREEMSALKREHNRLVSEQNRAIQDVAGQQSQTKAEMEELVRAKAQVDVDLKTNRDRVLALQEEVERLRRQVHTLQQESADKEVKIVQLNKLHAQDREDIAGLNIALDSKQQELELLKRKIGVKGTAGSTPAQPSKNVHRRDSSIFSATPLSRPPSVISDVGTDAGTAKKERKPSTDTPTPRASALAKSSRINTASALKSRASVEGTMGPPSLKGRPSMGTPTPASGRNSALSRSSSAKAAMAPVAPTHVPHRRVSSVAEQAGFKSKLPRSPTASVPEQDEKENIQSQIPTLA